MTFYELKGLLGCEKPIFHLTTGGVQKAGEGGYSPEALSITTPLVILLAHPRCLPALPALPAESGKKQTEWREAVSRLQAGKNLEALTVEILR